MLAVPLLCAHPSGVDHLGGGRPWHGRQHGHGVWIAHHEPIVEVPSQTPYTLYPADDIPRLLPYNLHSQAARYHVSRAVSQTLRRTAPAHSQRSCCTTFRKSGHDSHFSDSSELRDATLAASLQRLARPRSSLTMGRSLYALPPSPGRTCD